MKRTGAQNPVVIVTGASKGIGAAVAAAFAGAGYDVCLNYRTDAEGAARSLARCLRAGVRAMAVPGDVSDRAAVAALFAVCDRDLGPVTCLVNNAGIIGGATGLADLGADALRATFATNVDGSLYCLQEAVARMRTDRGGAGGAVINMSSVAAVTGSPGEYVHYAASKAALETLTIGAGKELGRLGVRVNAIRVGTTATDLHRREGNPERPAAVAAVTPLGRIAEPGDIADAALFLSSEQARFISGTVLTVAGGLMP